MTLVDPTINVLYPYGLNYVMLDFFNSAFYHIQISESCQSQCTEYTTKSYLCKHKRKSQLIRTI